MTYLTPEQVAQALRAEREMAQIRRRRRGVAETASAPLRADCTNESGCARSDRGQPSPRHHRYDRGRCEVSLTICKHCNDEHVCHVDQRSIPPQPPVGTWVEDRHGGISFHQVPDGWGVPGIMPLGRWEFMWDARGPLVECGPWGRDDTTEGGAE